VNGFGDKSAHQFIHYTRNRSGTTGAAVALVPTPWHCLVLLRRGEYKSLLYTHTKEFGESVADSRRRHFQADAKMLGDVDDVVFRLARPKIMLQKTNT
jgi:hypothetical protein